MSLFASDTPSGIGGKSISRRKNVLNTEQQSTHLVKGEEFAFDPVPYTLVLDDFSCPEVPFICATLHQGKKPKPGFGLEGYPDNDALTGCTKAPKCIGKHCLRYIP